MTGGRLILVDDMTAVALFLYLYARALLHIYETSLLLLLSSACIMIAVTHSRRLM